MSANNTGNLSLPPSNEYRQTTSNMMNSGNETTTSYEQSRRQVSSIIISEELLTPTPDLAPVVYVEVPVVEERVRAVPVRSVVEVEKVVPKYEYEYVDKIVEVPQIHYVDRTVEREIVQEVIRNVGTKQIQDLPREVIRTVPKVEYVQVEKIVNVPGEIIEVPRPYTVEQKVDVSRFMQKEVPVVVAQTIQPVITESAEVFDVDIYEYEPKVIPVEVHVAKPISSQLIAVGATQHIHQPVVVPPAQFNSLLKALNLHLSSEHVAKLPYIRENNGQVTFLPPHETPHVVIPSSTVQLNTAVRATGGTTSSIQQITGHSMIPGTTTNSSALIGAGHQQLLIPPPTHTTTTITSRDGTTTAAGGAPLFQDGGIIHPTTKHHSRHSYSQQQLHSTHLPGQQQHTVVMPPQQISSTTTHQMTGYPLTTTNTTGAAMQGNAHMNQLLYNGSQNHQLSSQQQHLINTSGGSSHHPLVGGGVGHPHQHHLMNNHNSTTATRYDAGYGGDTITESRDGRVPVTTHSGHEHEDLSAAVGGGVANRSHRSNGSRQKSHKNSSKIVPAEAGKKRVGCHC